eukprot:1716932-Prymnesium_polylepis.1
MPQGTREASLTVTPRARGTRDKLPVTLGHVSCAQPRAIRVVSVRRPLYLARASSEPRFVRVRPRLNLREGAGLPGRKKRSGCCAGGHAFRSISSSPSLSLSSFTPTGRLSATAPAGGGIEAPLEMSRASASARASCSAVNMATVELEPADRLRGASSLAGSMAAASHSSR